MSPLDAFPDVRRSDAGTVLVSSWIVPEARFQRPAADAALAAWEARRRPDAMLALTALLSTDGTHVLYYAQWTDDEAHREWARTARPAAIEPIDRAIPGIHRPGVVRYRRYRSHTPEEAVRARPGYVATPAFATTGPDAQRALADTVIGLLEKEHVPGLLAAHFHASKDGTRVLNVAEWASGSAWEEFAAGGVSARLREAIGALPGVTPVAAVTAVSAEHPAPRPRVAGYLPYKTLVNVPPPQGR
ncbi:antibiotic biosynthesis monooxygenase [Streptomyces sp. NRRL F-4489]|uniref:antibiotic biosynthesis monooxygenase n=1 Tax=Streptomyces sp. NRRL F-4489 TaxID=1609095 RepID=UPI0007474C05|nr:antibiotic biosynthesis monooxygenase [Streptomyces sp. NRRL F-4489]KUL53356.1 antibiotic biosynthesis monooxygenase [Streptomyces sp. NRRL F-4489]